MKGNKKLSEKERDLLFDRAIRAKNFRGVRTIDEAADRCIEALGGVSDVRSMFRNSSELDGLLDDMEMQHNLAHPLRFLQVPLGLVPALKLGDSPAYRDIGVDQIVRDEAILEVQRRIVEKVFPRGRAAKKKRSLYE